MTTFSAIEKLACAERELKMRQGVYPKWVGGGKMKAEKAAHEIAVMKAISDDYRALVEKGEEVF